MWEKLGFNFNRDEFKRKTENRLILWNRERFILRLWEKDPSLWADSINCEIAERLGWLSIPDRAEMDLKEIRDVNQIIEKTEISHIVLLGMGGSSLAAQMFFNTIKRKNTCPVLYVLSSTHPAAIREIETSIDPRKAIFIVSSKSGTTLETLSFFRYFWSLTNRCSSEAGRHFIAITDPGSYLDQLAQKRNFLKIFYTPSDIGGRFSAFTFFGMVPPYLGGVNMMSPIIYAKEEMIKNKPPILEQTADGIVLGALLGEMALAGKDKLTFITDPSLMHFPYWLEQLIAESLGKKGKGIVPIVSEPIAPIECYGTDRVFIYITLSKNGHHKNIKFIEKLEAKGFPVIGFNLENRFSLGRELYRWEIAVAAAGAVLRVNPFDQPDVQMAKDFTRNAMEKDEEDNGGEIKTTSINNQEEVILALGELLQGVKDNRYFSLHAYLHKEPKMEKELEEIRLQLLKKTHLATALGYGPSFLHSSGQMHKGGPNLGLFIQLVDNPGFDLKVPETDYSFLSMIRAQSSGDFQALREKGRRIIRIDLGESVEDAVHKLLKIIQNF